MMLHPRLCKMTGSSDMMVRCALAQPTERRDSFLSSCIAHTACWRAFLDRTRLDGPLLFSSFPSFPWVLLFSSQITPCIALLGGPDCPLAGCLDVLRNINGTVASLFCRQQPDHLARCEPRSPAMQGTSRWLDSSSRHDNRCGKCHSSRHAVH